MCIRDRFSTSFRDNDAINNNRVLSFEVIIDSNFQRSELELDFAMGNPFVIESDLNAGLSVDITGTCNAPMFFEGSSESLPDRVEINLLVDDDATQIAALTSYTDTAGETWGLAGVETGVYEFGVSDADAVQQAFTADLVSGIEIQITRVINHQWAFYDDAVDQLRVTDAAEMRDQLQTQPTPDLLSVSTQFPTAIGSPTEGRENQIPTVRGLDNFMANGNLRSLVELFDGSMNTIPTTFNGWLLVDISVNHIWHWEPTNEAITNNDPRSVGQYRRFGGTPITTIVNAVPTVGPNAEDPSNIRILSDRSAVYLFVGPNDTDWLDIAGGGDGGGSGQLGFSMEQLGIVTAPASTTNYYVWPNDVTSGNFSGLNGWGYNVQTSGSLVATNPTDEVLFNLGGKFNNNTGSSFTIRNINLDSSILVQGDGGNVTYHLIIIHSDGATTPTYTRTRTTAQTTSLIGFRTATIIPANPIVVGHGEIVSTVLQGLQPNQSSDITGLRFSDTTVSWLNPAYPIRESTGTGLSAEQARIVNASASTGLQNVIATTQKEGGFLERTVGGCLLYTSPSPRDS